MLYLGYPAEAIKRTTVQSGAFNRFEVLLAADAYNPAGRNGNGLIWFGWHGILIVSTPDVGAR